VTSLLLLLFVPLFMWLAQTAMLARHGLPIRRRIDARDAPRDVRTVGRLVTQFSLLAVIVVYPLLIGQMPPHYYARLLPADQSVWGLPHGAAASVLFLGVLFLVWVSTDCLEVDVHQPRRRWQRRLVLLVPTALLGALIEELLFRGVVMADLLRWFPQAPYSVAAVSAFIFAGAHYVRGVKRRWTFPGHLVLGTLLCLAFLRTGSLWLSVGLHAGGILMIMGTRPFFAYRGPSWLTGASVFPFAGAAGIAGLVILTAFVVTHYGAR
jgi:membrane protease YdiL (CAAX protease family)